MRGRAAAVVFTPCPPPAAGGSTWWGWRLTPRCWHAHSALLRWVRLHMHKCTLVSFTQPCGPRQPNFQQLNTTACWCDEGVPCACMPFLLQAHGAHIELVTAKVEKSLLQDCTADLVRAGNHSCCSASAACSPAHSSIRSSLSALQTSSTTLPRGPLTPSRSPSCTGCTWWTPPEPLMRPTACCAPTASWQRPGTTGGASAAPASCLIV